MSSILKEQEDTTFNSFVREERVAKPQKTIPNNEQVESKPMMNEKEQQRMINLQQKYLKDTTIDAVLLEKHE